MFNNFLSTGFRAFSQIHLYVFFNPRIHVVISTSGEQEYGKLSRRGEEKKVVKVLHFYYT